MKESTVQRIVWALGLLLVAAAVYLWWWPRTPEPAPPPPPVQPAVADAPIPTPTPAPASAPAVAHPIEAVEAPQEQRAPVASSRDAITDALVDLLGRKAVLEMLNTDEFARRIVATVDNLPREQATSRLWPVQPTGGRFTVTEKGNVSVLSSENAKRYEPFVRMVTSADVGRVAALYLRLYPQFQKAYEDLGFPGRYFNDRLVEVIDHLLATPDPASPPQMVLTEVRGPVQPTRPWVNYDFSDPDLRARSAGQKIMLRMGTENAQALKGWLTVFRTRITRSTPAR
jgi:hypothetical protein